MKYIRLGNSDLNVFRICMGCMGFGDASNGQQSEVLYEKIGYSAFRSCFNLYVRLLCKFRAFGKFFRNGLHTLEQAEKIGLGSRTYELVSIDD